MLNNKAKPTNILNQQIHPSTALDALLYDLYYFSQTGDYFPIKPFKPTFFFWQLRTPNPLRNLLIWGSSVVFSTLKRALCPSILFFFPVVQQTQEHPKAGFLPSKFYPQIIENGRCGAEPPPKDGCSSLCRGKEDAWRWDEGGEVLSSPAKLPQSLVPNALLLSLESPCWQQPRNQTWNDHFTNNKPQNPSLLRCKGGSPRRLGRVPWGPPCEICACLHYHCFILETTNYFISPDLHTNIKAEAIPTPI